jgi:hypothetical protein
MWKAGSGMKVEDVEVEVEDDWETDADFVVRAGARGARARQTTASSSPSPGRLPNKHPQNNVSEKEQRWGSKTVAGSGTVAPVECGRVKGAGSGVATDAVAHLADTAAWASCAPRSCATTAKSRRPASPTLRAATAASSACRRTAWTSRPCP